MTNMIVQSAELMPALTMNAVAERRNMIVEFTRQAMKDGIDFGVIPGTGQKPTLLKPGAEKLCTLFGLAPSFETTETIKDWTGDDHGGEPLFYFEIKCKLFRAGFPIAEGDGICHSWEKKYRFREAKRLCPDCGMPTIIKGRKEFGGGWLCFKKQGGCGAKFFDGDASIETQEIGQVSNPDMPDLINTIKKMAVKRALVAAILIAVNASEFFTQDLDDQVIEGHYTVEATPAAEPEQSARPPIQTINGNLRKPQATPSEARAKFYDRFGPALAHPETDATWGDVRRLLGMEIDEPEPNTVEGWRYAWKVVDAALSAEAQQAA